MESELTFERVHSLQPDEFLARIVDLAMAMQEDLNLDMSWSEDYKSLNFKSVSGMTKGLTGTLHIMPNRVRMVLQLPLGLRPMSAMFRSEVEQYLDQNIRSPDSDGEQKI